MDPGHAVQPRLPELRGAGVGLGQTVLEVHQHLWVVLVLLHLGGGHENCADPFGQVLHVRGEGGVLKQGCKDTWLSATSAHPHTSQMVRQSREWKIKGEGATHLDEPVTVSTVVDDRQGLLESGSPDAHNICYQLADWNNDLRDTQTGTNQFTFKRLPQVGSSFSEDGHKDRAKEKFWAGNHSSVGNIVRAIFSPSNNYLLQKVILLTSSILFAQQHTNQESVEA